MEAKYLDTLGLTSDEQALLQRFAFDAQSFAHLRGELAAGRFQIDRNVVQDPIAPPLAEDITPWPQQGENPTARLHQMGQEAIDKARVGVAILNGGMATRFGGRVKGVVEVWGKRSFLAIKLQAVARAGAHIPVFLMNSFATDQDTRTHLRANDYFGLPEQNIHFVHQGISLRLTPEGDLFRDSHGQVSCYAPGHGDLLAALSTCSAFQDFAKQTGTLLAVSNVDNLGATVAPKVLGAHLQAAQPITVEVASRSGGDTGGAPVRRGNKLEVLEGFRFPKDFAMDRLPVFNTNSFIMNTQVIRGDYPLTWFRADKKVDNQPVVQFERLVGEVTSFVPATYLQVPRHGVEGRFMPVKTPEDIAAVLPLLQQRFGS